MQRRLLLTNLFFAPVLIPSASLMPISLRSSRLLRAAPRTAHVQLILHLVHDARGTEDWRAIAEDWRAIARDIVFGPVIEIDGQDLVYELVYEVEVTPIAPLIWDTPYV